MELLQLKYFKSAAETENISEAARQNYIPQSAMSKTISKLEKEIGTKLFDRKSNSMKLNQNGRIFLNAVDIALSSIEDAVKTINDCETVKGEISLLVLCNRRFVTNRIATFREKYPNINFVISHIFHDDPKDFDFCITGDNYLPKDFTSKKLLTEKYKIAVNKNHPFHNKKSPVSLSTLNHEKFICMSKKSLLMQDTMKFFSFVGINPTITIFCDDPYYVRKYVELGLGIAIIPENSWGSLLDNNTVLLDIKETFAQRTDVICYSKNKYISYTLNEFLNHLLS